MGFPEKEVQVMEQLMCKWKTRLEVTAEGKTKTSRWIKTRKGFLQRDSFLPVGFCFTEVPVAMLIEQSDGYIMRPSGNRNPKRTHSLFINDLKVYKQKLNETIVKASQDTGACCGVKKMCRDSIQQGTDGK